jgi:hypothetical protein
MAVSRVTPPGRRKSGLYLRTVGGLSVRPEVFKLEALRGRRVVKFQEAATPAKLTLKTADGAVELCIPEPKVMRVRGRNAGLRLSYVTPGGFNTGYALDPTHFVVNSHTRLRKYLLTPLSGRMVPHAPPGVGHSRRIRIDLLPDGETGIFEAAVEEFRPTWRARGYPGDFDAACGSVQRAFDRWLGRTPAVPPRYSRCRELAAYVNFSSVVEPRGPLTRPAMYMSKNWMCAIWSWDHCFNAIGLAAGNPRLAWDQLMVLFDAQDRSGALPDCVSESGVVWNFTKPPVHGWALRKMMQRTRWIDRERLGEIYRPLGRWTNWWLRYNDSDGDRIPDYAHGNDSGWDNCTAFDVGTPLEAPDLSAYLVIQMDVLARIARRLGRPGEAARWKARADELLARLIRHSWRGDRFVAPRSGDHRASETDTLLVYVPIVLGKRLPEPIRRKLVAALKCKGRFLTRHGLATESPRSRHYRSDGYWRGPIWAPSTLLIVDGLAACGEMNLARSIARRFCNLCASDGMAENFDALTGRGLRDRAYTWTASVFLILAREYLC